MLSYVGASLCREFELVDAHVIPISEYLVVGLLLVLQLESVPFELLAYQL